MGRISTLNLRLNVLKSVSLVGFAVFLGLGFSSGVFADQYFDYQRTDKNIPEKCRNFKIENFRTASKWVIYGISGATKKGFTHEYPISREEATMLWKAINSNNSNYKSTQLDILKTDGQVMGFDFKKEGDVLEALALVDLEREYPPNLYVMTGGLAYHEAGGPSLLGEVDVLVMKKTDCSVVAIGEAKLGHGQLSHAKSQLNRFYDFLDRKLCNSANFNVCLMGQIR